MHDKSDTPMHDIRGTLYIKATLQLPITRRCAKVILLSAHLCSFFLFHSLYIQATNIYLRKRHVNNEISAAFT